MNEEVKNSVLEKRQHKKFKDDLASVIGLYRIKGLSLNTKQLLKLYKFYRKYEDELSRNYRKRDIFLEYLEILFTKTNSYQKDDKIVIWENLQFNKIIKECEKNIKGSTRISTS